MRFICRAGGVAAIVVAVQAIAMAGQLPAPSTPQAPLPVQVPAPQPLVPVQVSIEPSGESFTLTYFNRPIVVLRATVMGRRPEERGLLAVRVMDDLVAKNHTGPVQAVPIAAGALIGVGTQVIVGLTTADLDATTGESLDQAAPAVAQRVEQALTDAVTAHRPGVWLRAIAASLIGIFVGAALLIGLGRIRHPITDRLSALMGKGVARSGLGQQHARRLRGLLDVFQQRLVAIAIVVLQLAVLYATVTFVLQRFVYTRPWGDSLSASLGNAVGTAGLAVANALPSIFTVFLIGVVTRGVLVLLEPWFDAVERGTLKLSWMYPETATTTRRLVKVLFWLFAAALAYPYIPGSNTDAFKGMSLFVGLMVTLGSSGLVNQVMSGFMLTYSRALRLGDFVRIGTIEGTITHLGVLSVKLRTIQSEEVTIPNALVVTQTIVDYSRLADVVLTTSVAKIGYDAPWRQVHAMLVEAARRTRGIRATPPPAVFQLALDDFAVNYTLMFCLEQQHMRVVILSDLHANIQDLFNEHGVQIMTPNYMGDPQKPKLVPKAEWFASPAEPQSK
jgi:small-conductance mechanosensitive channel